MTDTYVANDGNTYDVEDPAPGAACQACRDGRHADCQAEAADCTHVCHPAGTNMPDKWDDMEIKLTGKPMFGTFAQETPGAGATWHLLVSETILEPLCGYVLTPGRFEVWTTDTMPAFKVCRGCREEASR